MAETTRENVRRCPECGEPALADHFLIIVVEDQTVKRFIGTFCSNASDHGSDDATT
ncbi:MAG: hypothetical protein ACXVJW_08765 [Acidimicrobiia bacterium]